MFTIYFKEVDRKTEAIQQVLKSKGKEIDLRDVNKMSEIAKGAVEEDAGDDGVRLYPLIYNRQEDRYMTMGEVIKIQ